MVLCVCVFFILIRLWAPVELGDPGVWDEPMRGWPEVTWSAKPPSSWFCRCCWVCCRSHTLKVSLFLSLSRYPFLMRAHTHTHLTLVRSPPQYGSLRRWEHSNQTPARNKSIGPRASQRGGLGLLPNELWHTLIAARKWLNPAAGSEPNVSRIFDRGWNERLTDFYDLDTQS